MKISIITPSLNSEKYIQNNLESVHLQQKGDFEIEQIIVDGNSTDRTIEIIESFKKKSNANIKVIQGKDKNMYDAINKGLKSITGDIWACLNTDDEYFPGTFPIVVDEFSNNSEIDVVYGRIEYTTENGNRINTVYLPKFELEYLILKGGAYNINQPSTFLKKNVIEKIGFFDIGYKYASDYDYLIRVASKSKMEKINKNFTKFRVHPQSISVGENTHKILKDEAKEISQKYMDDLSIEKRSILVDDIKYYLTQVKSNNLRYYSKRVAQIFLNFFV